jgi:hypothetical protein
MQPQTHTTGVSWLESVRRAVDERLARFFDEERATVRALAADASLVLGGRSIPAASSPA